MLPRCFNFSCFFFPRELKARRRAEQEAHVLKKKALKELMDKKSLEGVKNKFKSQSTEEGEESKPTEGPQSEEESDYEEVPQEEGTKGKRDGDDEEDVEDAIEWFRKEVGEEPGEGIRKSFNVVQKIGKKWNQFVKNMFAVRP